MKELEIQNDVRLSHPQLWLTADFWSTNKYIGKNGHGDNKYLKKLVDTIILFPNLDIEEGTM